jgi:site-specific recombinase XerD
MTTRSTKVAGPLAEHSEGLRLHLDEAGYSPYRRRNLMCAFAELNDWLVAEGLSPACLVREEVSRFLAHSREKGAKLYLTTRGLSPVLDYLRSIGAVPAGSPEDGAIAVVLDAYSDYMQVERLLAPLTIYNNLGVARRFLAQYGEARCCDLSGLRPSDVNGYIVRESEHQATGTVGANAYALRDLVRFLYATGVVPRDISPAIPGVSAASRCPIPKGVSADVVTALLNSCDRRRPQGLRDYAILKLLVRLGLRSIEVSSMTLDDIDWRAGEFTVTGKGRRRDLLPLPIDVGEAVADYVANGRPETTSRAVFLLGTVPSAPISRNAVVFVPRRASVRAGIPVVGAHRLRHTCATEMLASGASLREIAQVLRHESEVTTAIYASVQMSALKLAVKPWPVTP